MHRQPRYPPPSAGAVPHTPPAEGGLHPTPAGQTERDRQHAAGQVRPATIKILLRDPGFVVTLEFI